MEELWNSSEFKIIFYGENEMDIIVLVKTVPKSKNAKLNSDFTISRQEAKIVINPSDQTAIEEALRIREIVGGKVIVLSLGSEKSKNILRHAVAMGADEAVLICDDKYRGSDTYATAHILSETIKKMYNSSLIICGKRSTDGSTSQVPIEIAAMLDINFSANVSEFNLIPNGIECFEEYEEIRVKRILYYPALLTVSTEANTPRIPTVERLAYSKNYNVKVISNELLQLENDKCGIIGSLTHVIRTTNVNNRKTRNNIIYRDKNDIKKNLLECFEKTRVYEREQAECLEIIDLYQNSKTEIVVFCEISHGSICKESLDVIETANYLANKLNSQIVTISTRTDDNDKMLWDLSLRGVSVNYQLNIEDVYSTAADLISNEVTNILNEVKPRIVLFACTERGKILAPYVATRTISGLTADCIELDINDGMLFQTRPAYGGNINAEIISKNSKYEMATVKPFVNKKQYRSQKIKTKNIIYQNKIGTNSDISMNKTNCVTIDEEVVIGIGMGVGNQKNVNRIIDICRKNKYGMCATREIVDKGWMPYEYQVGLTGKIVSPKVYLAMGISGANEHMVGIGGSDTIVSVNLNVDEPICQNSDYIYEVDVEAVLDMLDKLTL